MATFQKLTDVAVAEVVSEQANVFIEDGGELKRVAKSQVGGAGSLADLKDVVYFHFSMVAPEEGSVESTDSDGNVFKCNKTFNEILDLILTHELKMVTGVVWQDSNWNQTQIQMQDWYLIGSSGSKVFDITAESIVFCGVMDSSTIYWYITKDDEIILGNPGGVS